MIYSAPRVLLSGVGCCYTAVRPVHEPIQDRIEEPDKTTDRSYCSVEKSRETKRIEQSETCNVQAEITFVSLMGSSIPTPAMPPHSLRETYCCVPCYTACAHGPSPALPRPCPQQPEPRTKLPWEFLFGFVESHFVALGTSWRH